MKWPPRPDEQASSVIPLKTSLDEAPRNFQMSELAEQDGVETW